LLVEAVVVLSTVAAVVRVVIEHLLEQVVVVHLLRLLCHCV
jgi:hypothetical protein